MFVNVYVVYVWDVCNEIYFHLYKEIFMIPLIFKLIDTDNSCHLHDKQSDLYYWSYLPCRGELELPCGFPIRLLAYPASCHTWLPKNV